MPAVRRLYSGIAVLLPLAIIALEATSLAPFINGHIWFLLYPTLFISSWIGTRRSALFATAAATVTGWWAFVTPRYTWGADKWLDLIPTLMLAATGTLFALFHDRLRRTTVRLQQALDDSRVFEALLANSSDFIGIADPSGRPVWVNPAGRRMIGLSEDYPIETTTIPEYYAPDARDFAANVIVKEMIEKGHWSGETSFRNWQTGQTIPVSDTHFLIREPRTGRTVGMGTITRDISEITRARDALNELERMRFEWTSIVAHDLKQPITAITLKSSMLLRQPLTSDQRRDVSQIRASAERLNGMVSDLMDVSLLDAKQIRLALARVDLGALAREVVDRMPLAAARSVVRTPIDVGLFVKGDADRLEQVIANVLSNAVKYGAPDTEILIEVRQSGGDAELLVTNRGAGIPADELPVIFDRYVRGAAGATAKGLGLGLHIAKGLVEAHGGRIWAESIPGDLTTFHIALPLDGSPMPIAPVSPSDAATVETPR